MVKCDNVKTAICFVGLAYMYIVCIDFQTHCVLNRSAFLLMSNYIMHNFSCRQFYLDGEERADCFA